MWKRKASLPGRRPCNMLQRSGWQVRRVLGDWKRSILATWEVLQPANPRACRHQRIAQPHVIVRAKHSEQADRVWRQNDAFDCSFHCIAKKGTLDISWFAKGSVINTSIYEVGGTKASQIFSTTSCPYPFLYMAQLTWAPKHDVRHHEIEGRKLRPVACDRETEVQQDWNSSETIGTSGLDWTVYLRYFQNDYPPHLGTKIWTLTTLDCDSNLCFLKKRFLEFRAMISCWEVSWIWKSLLSLVSPWCIPFCSLRLLYGSASKRDMLRQIDLLAWSIP